MRNAYQPLRSVPDEAVLAFVRALAKRAAREDHAREVAQLRTEPAATDRQS